MSLDASKKPFVIGILSDTHGPVPQNALDALQGVDHILHAGDVVGETVLDALSHIAPVTAVRGNMDRRAIGPLTQYVTLADVSIYVIHDIFQLDIEPQSADVDMVVHGHTHRPKVEYIRDVLHVNPGSAAHPRAGLPPTVAKVTIEGGTLFPELIRLR